MRLTAFSAKVDEFDKEPMLDTELAGLAGACYGARRALTSARSVRWRGSLPYAGVVSAAAHAWLCVAVARVASQQREPSQACTHTDPRVPLSRLHPQQARLALRSWPRKWLVMTLTCMTVTL